MKSKIVAALSLASVGLVACDHLPKPGSRDVISMAGPEGTIGSLFVWSNDVNAGMVDPNGKICMQRAMTMRSVSARGETSIPASIVSASAALETAATQGKDQAAIALSGAISQAAAALATTTERTAFLDIGMFYLCQLHANEAITGAQSAALTAQLIRDAALIVPVAGYLPAANAPDLGETPRMPAPTAPPAAEPDPEVETPPVEGQGEVAPKDPPAP